MSRRSPARRLASVLGVLLLLGGIAAAAILFVLGPRYRDRQVDQLARGVVGCVTPLVFTETGTFYVYQEVAGPDVAPNGCAAAPRAGDFAVAVSAPDGSVELVDDRSVSYSSDGAIGTSIRRFDVSEVGVYELTVNGPDAATRAAVGPDPEQILDDYRQWALIAGLSGVVVGLALLLGSSIGARHQVAAPAAAPGSPFAPPGVPAATLAPPAAPLQTPAEPPHDPWGAPSVGDRRG